MTKKVADYFMEHGQFDKAMEILVKSKKIREALDLCMAHNITLTEDLVERMTIPKKPNGKVKLHLWYTGIWLLWLMLTTKKNNKKKKN